jgi:hypothetical protein
MRLAVLASLALLSATGCSDDSPTAPSGPPPAGPRSGVWVGTIVDTANTSGTLRLDLGERVADPTTSVLSGTWMMTFADAQRNGRGSLSGLVNGTQWAALGVTEPPASCPPVPFAAPGSLSIIATATTAEIAGTFNYAVCGNAHAGTITLRRP